MSKITTTIVILSGLAILASGCADTPKSSQACFEEHCFEVELAETVTAQADGLKHRDYLAADTGMLFIFPEEQQPDFWMKDVLIPLDIIWIDADQKVVSINENVQPCQIENCPTIKPTEKIRYVLEVNGGATRDLGLETGDHLKLNID